MRSCIQDEPILKVEMPIRIAPFYPSMFRANGRISS